MYREKEKKPAKKRKQRCVDKLIIVENFLFICIYKEKE